MGEAKVSVAKDQKELQTFMRNLLNDLQSLEYMIDHNWFETGITRIGAEQEMCIVDSKTYKPAKINLKVIEAMKDCAWLDTELAQFNLETNMTPVEFTGNCFRQMEDETLGNIAAIRKTLEKFGANIALTGILPTLRKTDLDLENLTEKPRYMGLMKALESHLIGNSFELNLLGIDELHVKHDSPLLEACNTSFQVHLQVEPKDFVCLYNIAQMLTGPIIAISANSPMVFGKRLWHETRIALFQQALDTRTSHDHLRERSPRVNFGNGWLQGSILEIYKEDIARFRVLMTADEVEDSIEQILKKKTPKLKALQVHNSTVYRWNRPCYGISDNGQPHLRIEARVLPAGPTIVDEVANAAFWLGAMIGMQKRCYDVTTRLSWEDVRDNFMKAAQYGIDTKFNWFDDKKHTATDLIINELLPVAKEGLEMKGVDSADIDRYLGIIHDRAKAHMTGARWQLRAFTKLKESITTDEATAVMTACIVKNQEKEMPVHTWPLPEPSELEEYVPSRLRVEEFMTTDLITVQKDILIDFVAEMMNWRKIRYMPVEDAKGRLVGLVTSRHLLRHYSHNNKLSDVTPTSTVEDIMLTKPLTVTPRTTIMAALKIMRENKVGCLPVVHQKDNELVGIITEMDFLRVSSRLMERLELAANK
ncbi:MAG: CBS domain-containing protein [Saprospiraceae bacterium]|nr:CBS domain-containing protein [Saprospiraceae bacterium]MCF8251324.1 CBS domain-containing protein [Saprospiraceae bacterium]MCF8280625.1 CBS domain-containing protein [Bacteroidales bacterium]MCF8313199.1 CBS domain-containing protein [Saprospiraceae bacterium]MCF8441637.1 CBS domain-containing protein [Saprospiraceae bacterium]